MNKLLQPVHIICVIDESGSMAGSQAQVIESFNSTIAQHRETFGDDARVSLYKFGAGGVTQVMLKQHITEVAPMTSEQYVPAGGTPLNDAIGKAVEDHRGLERVFFVVDTDGHENTSKEYTREGVRSLVEQQKALGWDFTFIGADLSQEATLSMSASFGLAAGDTMAFAKSADGYATRSTALFAKMTAYSNSIATNMEDGA